MSTSVAPPYNIVFVLLEEIFARFLCVSQILTHFTSIVFGVFGDNIVNCLLKMVFKWRDDHTILVLDLLQNEECLWNSQSSLYRNKSSRDKALENIVRQLNLPGVTTEDIKLKIKSIRSRYSSELGKVINSERCGDDVYEPKLFWYQQADAFLRPVCSPRVQSAPKVGCQVDSNLDIEIIEPESNESHFTPLLSHKDPENHRMQLRIAEISDNVDSVDSENKEEISPVTNHLGIKRKREPQLPVNRGLLDMNNVIDKIRKISDNRGNLEDEFDLFAKSLAVQLKKMPLRRALVCQGRLQQVMIEERMFQIDSEAHSIHQQPNDSKDPKSPWGSPVCRFVEDR